MRCSLQLSESHGGNHFEYRYYIKSFEFGNGINGAGHGRLVAVHARFIFSLHLHTNLVEVSLTVPGIPGCLNIINIYGWLEFNGAFNTM